MRKTLVALAVTVAVAVPGTAQAAVSVDGVTTVRPCSYSARVPSVVGLDAQAARLRLMRSRLGVGSVRVQKGAAAPTLTVVTQFPAPGAVTRACSRVDLILGE